MFDSLTVQKFINKGFNKTFVFNKNYYMLDDINNAAIIKDSNGPHTIYYCVIFNEKYKPNVPLVEQNIYQIHRFFYVNDLEAFINNKYNNFAKARNLYKNTLPTNKETPTKGTAILVHIEDYLGTFSESDLYNSKSTDINADLQIIMDKLKSIYATTGSFQEFLNLIEERISKASSWEMIKSSKENLNSI